MGEFATIYTVEEDEDSLNPINTQLNLLSPANEAILITQQQNSNIPSNENAQNLPTELLRSQKNSQVLFNPNNEGSTILFSSNGQAITSGQVGVPLPFFNNQHVDLGSVNNALGEPSSFDRDEETIVDIMRNEDLTTSIDILEDSGLLTQLLKSGKSYC